MKTLCGTVVYENQIDLTKVYIDNLNEQTFSDFEVLIINDDLSKEKIDHIKRCVNRKVYIYDFSYKLKPYELRIKMIEKAIELEFDLLVLTDFDDIMSSNRIEEHIKKFDTNYAFFYNQLKKFNSNENYFDKIPVETLNVEQIYYYNYLGLSNTSLNLKKIKNVDFRKISNTNPIAFDWMFYSYLLLIKFKGKYITDCFTGYRLHDLNTAVIKGSIKEKIEWEVKVKLNHYAIMKQFHNKYLNLYVEYLELSKNLEKNLSQGLNYSNENTFWWGNIFYK